MAKRRGQGRFSLKEERQLIQMAAAPAPATVEEAAAILRTSVGTIERKAERLGIKLKGKRPKLGLKARK
jgi:transcriptional regulator with GAF, ATPase, and Fis domain